jgi:hypothetical protein
VLEFSDGQETPSWIGRDLAPQCKLRIQQLRGCSQDTESTSEVLSAHQVEAENVEETPSRVSERRPLLPRKPERRSAKFAETGRYSLTTAVQPQITSSKVIHELPHLETSAQYLKVRQTRNERTSNGRHLGFRSAKDFTTEKQKHQRKNATRPPRL